jgi:ComF family protein
VAKGVRALLNSTISLLFPDDCRVCGSALSEFSRIPVCSKCLTEPQPLVAEYSCSDCKTPFLNAAPLDEQGRCTLCRLGLQGFDAVYTYGSYEGPLRDLVHLFKFGGMRPLVATFGDLLARALPREASFDAIVPMPLHWMRRWQRGFNQSSLLAVEISRRWNTPIAEVARRSKPTVSQAGLTSSKRRLNVRGAFKVRGRLDGAHILLVDDVLTTGATASACARALKRAGAARVTLLALARTDRRAAIDLSTLRTEGAHA